MARKMWVEGTYRPRLKIYLEPAIKAQFGKEDREYGDKMARKFSVTVGDELVATYYTFGWGPWDNQGAGPVSLPAVATVTAAVADLLKHRGQPFPPGYAEPEDRQRIEAHEHFAVWFNTHLVAVALPDPDNGEPIVSVFNDIDLHNIEFDWD